MTKWIVPLIAVMFLFASPVFADGGKDRHQRRSMNRRGPDRHQFQSRERPSRYNCQERPSRYSRHSSTRATVILIIPGQHGTVRFILRDGNQRPQHRYPFRQRRWHRRRY